MNNQPYHAAVFGATSAIAFETLRAIASERPAFFLLIGRNQQRLESIATDLRQRGAECRIAMEDLLNPDRDWSELLSGRTWNLLYIAHGSLPDQDMTLSDSHATGREIDVNFISPVRIANACVRKLEEQKRGSLAIIGSVAGDRGRQSNYFYGATKAGLNTFTEGLAHRFADSPEIHITLLKPGMTDTPMTADIPKGPLFSSAQKVGSLAWKAISKHKTVAYLPGWWWAVMNIIRHLPRPVFHRTKL